jgi:hypothetical protein
MKIEPWHRRLAVQLASQLPDQIEDGRIILRLTTELLEDFLNEPETTKKLAPVITIGDRTKELKQGGSDG